MPILCVGKEQDIFRFMPLATQKCSLRPVVIVVILGLTRIVRVALRDIRYGSTSATDHRVAGGVKSVWFGLLRS